MHKIGLMIFALTLLAISSFAGGTQARPDPRRSAAVFPVTLTFSNGRPDRGEYSYVAQAYDTGFARLDPALDTAFWFGGNGLYGFAGDVPAGTAFLLIGTADLINGVRDPVAFVALSPAGQVINVTSVTGCTP